MKKTKILFFFFVSALFFVSADFILAENNLNIYFFWGEGCPHCEKEKDYFNNILKNKYPDISIYDFEIYNNRDNILLLQKISQKLNITVEGVPFTIIGDKQFTGFSEYSTPKDLENRIEYCLSNQCPDSIAELAGVTEDNKPDGDIENGDGTKNEINLPFIGAINPTSFSLPVLTVVMGALDGFNPCAMWTLLFLISLLLGMQNRKRMWILGTAFIVASAFVYFLFMAAWLNLILFLGFIIWVRIFIGLVALASGVYNLREFFVNKYSICKIAGEEKRQKVFDKIKLITQMHSFWLALGGIIILAFAVNLVELICSAGLPAIYTQVLSLNNLAGWQYYLYIALYIFIFMLDDLIVFFAAMITLEVSGISAKYTRASRLIGGFLMLVIGLLLIFKPQLLMFGF